MRSYKEQYKDFCKLEKNIPIFSQDWWLDAVCGEDNWDVALVFNKSNEIIASMPYAFKRKFGKLIIRQPLLTQHIGAYIKYPPLQSTHKKLSHEIKVSLELIDQLPNYLYFSQNFSPKFNNWLPFYWAGYSHSQKVTYQISKLTLLEYNNSISSARRRRIKKAKRLNISIQASDDIRAFYHLNKKTFIRQNIAIPYEESFVVSLYNSIVSRGEVVLKFAYDEHGTILAGIFLVIDSQTVYYLMGGIEPKHGDMGAMDLLMDHSIKEAINRNKIFDFEGSMNQTIERYFRSFGAEQVPYSSIYKSSSKILSALLGYKGK